ncbi:MAG: PDZ domain-containing protein [Burkholderiales bacterium]|nr:MAG: PDZ domain-containing protein [Burkholderiales bacterium]
MNGLIARIAIAVTAVFMLSGCASGYSQYYEPNNAMLGSPIGVDLSPGATPTVIASSGDAKIDTLSLYSQGLGLLGSSSFNGANEGAAGAIGQAKKIGATHIVMSAQYARTVSGAIPMTVPTTTTSYTSGTATAYGAGGYASGNYSGTTTTYGSQTTMVPYSVDRYDQSAGYFAPLKRRGYGMMQMPLAEDQVRLIGSNKGMFIAAVRRGSPAFLADILPGDFILSINGQPVYDEETFAAATAWGRPLILQLWRNGATLEKKMAVAADGSWQ